MLDWDMVSDLYWDDLKGDGCLYTLMAYLINSYR